VTLLRLKGGRVIDPANGRDEVADLHLADGRVVAAPAGEPDETIDVSGRIVMAGGIDIHSHIAGANVNTARLMLPESHRAHSARPGLTPLSAAGWSAEWTGLAYARMGFTLVVEPAMAPATALQTHMELADTPVIDRAALTILGNERMLLRLLSEGAGEDAVADYAAAVLGMTQGFGVKVINAGAAAAFADNVRRFDLDDAVPGSGLTSRRILTALQRAVVSLGLPHRIHVHCNRLGIPGSFETAIATMDAGGAAPLHLAHLQFYAYGREGRRRFSSAAAELAAAVNARPHVTIDVGQVMFGPTVTISGDVTHQFAARAAARPPKWTLHETDGNGFGIVPFDYRESDFYNAVQFAAGLELFLLVEDPWRVFFTTDHPNGAPFTTYPRIIRLLMDRDARAEALERLPKAAVEQTTLPSITREYTLPEIAVLTRAAPARLLGLPDRGHLGPGAVADVAVYDDLPDRAKIFGKAALVLKDGAVVVRDGEVVRRTPGRTLVADIAPAGRAMKRRMEAEAQARFGAPAGLFAVERRAVGSGARFEDVPCRT